MAINSMLREELQKKIVDAMKERDTVRVSTLKLLSTALLNAEIAKNREPLTKGEETTVIKREAKKRKDAIEIYQKAGAEDRVKSETEELSVLQEYLPPDIPIEEIENVVEEVIKETGAKNLSDMGKVMAAAMQKLEGADGTTVSSIVRLKLS